MSPVRRLCAVLVVAAALSASLAGCQLTVSSPDATPRSAATAAAPPKPTVSSTPTPVVPVQADIATYLLQGTPYQPDANGEWAGHYGFWTDSSHAVACDIYIYSGDSGGVSCGINPGHEAQRTYAIPAGASNNCDVSSSVASDGTAIAISYKEFGSDANPNANVGFSGCISDVDTSLDAKRLVLPPNNILTVTQQGFETYTCTVTAGVASCSDSKPGSSFVFGLSVASFHQG
jgi:hypothetical protein